MAAGTALTAPLVTVGAGVVMVLSLERRRVRRRRRAAEPARRIAGAWYEVADKLQEQGAAMPVGATPRAYVRGLREAAAVTDEEHHHLDALAREVNAAAYHPRPPDPVAAERSWDSADRVLASVQARRPVVRRVADRLDPKLLLRPDPLLRSKDGKPSEQRRTRRFSLLRRGSTKGFEAGRLGSETADRMGGGPTGGGRWARGRG